MWVDFLHEVGGGIKVKVIILIYPHLHLTNTSYYLLCFILLYEYTLYHYVVYIFAFMSETHHFSQNVRKGKVNN